MPLTLLTREINVEDPSGGTRKANLLCCGKCKNEAFLVYFIGEHEHRTCTKCQTMFCDGSCGIKGVKQ